MNLNPITNALISEQEIAAAQTSVSISVQRLEIALDHLAEKVGMTSESVQKAKHIVTAPKRFFLNAKGTVTDFSKQAVVSVKKNPRPFVAAAVGIVGVGILLYFAFRKPASNPQDLVKAVSKKWAKKLKSYL